MKMKLNYERQSSAVNSRKYLKGRKYMRKKVQMNKRLQIGSLKLEKLRLLIKSTQIAGSKHKVYPIFTRNWQNLEMRN